MTAMVRDAAERHADGRLVVVHEGGYSEAYVPFCGLAVIEELSGVRSAVRDPLRDFIELQQPNAAFRDFQAPAPRRAGRTVRPVPGAAASGGQVAPGPAPGRCTAPAR
ncbi:acetylpolyamine aminohydrolase [Pseudomonas aeruginosa]|nr:acetylpolyamine aminohydrolase [Pseudomonas aeruginosa]